MLKSKDQYLQTVLYSHISDPSREGIKSKKFHYTKGIAGEALTSGRAVIWDSNSPNFESSREKNEEFYISGLTIPFKVSGSHYVGLLNIDCKIDNKFNNDSYKELGDAIADMIALIIEAVTLWESRSIKNNTITNSGKKVAIDLATFFLSNRAREQTPQFRVHSLQPKD